MAYERYDWNNAKTIIEMKHGDALAKGKVIKIHEDESEEIFGKSIARANPGRCILEESDDPYRLEATVPRHLGKLGYSSRVGTEGGKKYVLVWKPRIREKEGKKRSVPKNLDQEIVSLIKQYVKDHSRTVDLQFDSKKEPKLPIDIYSSNYREKKKVAHYLLLVASVDEFRLVGKAENARRFLVYLYQRLGWQLFRTLKSSDFKRLVFNNEDPVSLGPSHQKIPDILTQVNNYVCETANFDLISYSKKFNRPREMVRDLSQIPRMGGAVQKKAWMYMRWMVRKRPDLGIFKQFSPKDLFIPLDTNVAKIAICLGLVENKGTLTWGDVKRITEFSRDLFPNDPAKVDEPFFLLGRKLRGSSDRKNLKSFLIGYKHCY